MRGAGVLVSFSAGAAASGLHGKSGPALKRLSAYSGGRACTRRRPIILGIERHIVRDGELPGGWICRASTACTLQGTRQYGGGIKVEHRDLLAA